MTGWSVCIYYLEGDFEVLFLLGIVGKQGFSAIFSVAGVHIQNSPLQLASCVNDSLFTQEILKRDIARPDRDPLNALHYGGLRLAVTVTVLSSTLCVCISGPPYHPGGQAPGDHQAGEKDGHSAGPREGHSPASGSLSQQKPGKDTLCFSQRPYSLRIGYYNVQLVH